MEDYPTEKWDEMIAVSLSAPFHLIKGFIKDMKRKGIYETFIKGFFKKIVLKRFINTVFSPENV